MTTPSSSGGPVSLREFFWPWTITVMIVGGVAVMLSAGFAHWGGLQQNVATWAWLATVAFYRAVWLLARPVTEAAKKGTEGRPAVVKEEQ